MKPTLPNGSTEEPIWLTREIAQLTHAWSEMSALPPGFDEQLTRLLGLLDRLNKAVASSSEAATNDFAAILESLNALGSRLQSFHTASLQLRQTLIACINSLRTLTISLESSESRSRRLEEELKQTRQELQQLRIEVDAATHEFNAMKRHYLLLSARLATGEP